VGEKGWKRQKEKGKIGVRLKLKGISEQPFWWTGNKNNGGKFLEGAWGLFPEKNTRCWIDERFSIH